VGVYENLTKPFVSHVTLWEVCLQKEGDNANLGVCTGDEILEQVQIDSSCRPHRFGIGSSRWFRSGVVRLRGIIRGSPIPPKGNFSRTKRKKVRSTYQPIGTKYQINKKSTESGNKDKIS